MAHAKVRVLIIEEFPNEKIKLFQLLNSDPAIDVIGAVDSAAKAIKISQLLKPTVIVMDADDPGLNSITTTRLLLEVQPVPIVILTGAARLAATLSTFRAIDAGAVAVLKKPASFQPWEKNLAVAKLIFTVKTVAGAKIRQRPPRSVPLKTNLPSIPPGSDCSLEIAPEIIAIGASTGGPPVLGDILSRLPESFPIPILIVQHIAHGFARGLADWLSKLCCLKVRIAKNGTKIKRREIYLAPDGNHLRVKRKGYLSVVERRPEQTHCPSVDVLFGSVADVYGANAVGILLTGMGRDGARNLKTMLEKGGITIAQDEKTSVVHGMPGEAIKIGAARFIMNPLEIAVYLSGLPPLAAR